MADPSLPAGPVEVADPELDRLRALFERLGGSGSIRCYRLIGGQEHYCGVIRVTPELNEGEIDDRLASTFGGGEFVLRGVLQHKSMGAACRAIDPRMFPARVSEVEQRRGDPPPAGAVGQAPAVDWMTWQRDAEERARRDRQELLAALSTVEEKRATQLAALASAMRGPAVSPTAGLDGLKDAIGFLKTLGWGPPDGGGGTTVEEKATPGRSIVEGVIEKAAAAAGTRVGEAIARAMAPEEAKPASPAAPAPALPKGTKPLTADQLADMRAKREANK